jgi:hypothetical protein
MEERTGTTAAALEGQPTGVTHFFDGVDDRVTVQHDAAYDFGSGDFTFEVTSQIADSGEFLIPLLSKREAGQGLYFIGFVWP